MQNTVVIKDHIALLVNLLITAMSNVGEDIAGSVLNSTECWTHLQKTSLIF